MTDNTYYPSIDFEDGVLSAEIKEIKQRKIQDIHGEWHLRGENDMLDFEQYITPKNKRSPVWSQVIDELNSDHNKQAWLDDEDAQHKGLVGLAYSGGGIRSSTVNLGLTQILKETGILKCVDYLSTVSGGGYVGSCISSMHTSIAKQMEKEPGDGSTDNFENLLKHKQGEPEQSIFRHLRNNSNYMAPNGIVDLLRIPSMFLRGIVINFFVLLPYILIASVISAWMIGGDFHPLNQFSEWLSGFGINLGQQFIATKTLLISIGIIFLLFPVANMYFQSFGQGKGPNGNWQIRNRSGHFLGYALLSVFGCALIELQPAVIAAYTQFELWGYQAKHIGIAGGIGGAGASVFATSMLSKLSSIFSRMSVYIIGLIGVMVFWIMYLHFTVLLIDASQVTPINDEFAWVSMLGFSLIAAILFAYSTLTVDANFTSVSRFYRDRLSKAFVVGLKKNDQIVHTDSVKLSELDTTLAPYHLLNSTMNLSTTSQAYSADRKGDFFMFSKCFIGSPTTGYCRTEDMEATSRNVNLATAMSISAAAAAPNMGKNTVKVLVFILGMLNIRYDYWLPNPKRLKKELFPKFLSGIASALKMNKLPSAPVRRVGPRYFLRELSGNLNADLPYVNLSDGGHIENLGVYELIRRQCRLIIVGDSEADSGLTFDGLANVMRMVQIDFGVKIVMDGLDDIRMRKQHHAIGTIYYSNNKVGKIVYIKTSLLDEQEAKIKPIVPKNNQQDAEAVALSFDYNPYIAHYKTSDPAFPHQSSGDQFFDESQFESYRALGHQMAWLTFCHNPNPAKSSQ
jgi:uncharacterized short protein YbdD (DUF466 family)